MAGKTFWQDQFKAVREGESPALTVEQQQERDKPRVQMKAPEQPQQEEQSIEAADVAKAGAIGVTGWAESMEEALSTPEMRQSTSATVPGMVLALADYVPIIKDTLTKASRESEQQFASAKDSIRQSMTQTAQKALQAELINEDLEFTDDATKLSTWIMKGTETLARMAPDLVAGGLTGQALYKNAYETAYRSGIAKGLTPQGAKIAANKIASASMAAPTAMMATTSATGGAGVQAREAIESLSWGDLQKSDLFVSNFKRIDADPANEGMTDREKLNLARTETAEQASAKIMKDPALLTVNALSSFVGDATLGKLLAGKIGGGVINKMVTGAVAEAPTEAAQSAMEQYAQNSILIDLAGQEFDQMKGVTRAAAEGGLLGGAIGGGVGGAAGVVDKATGRQEIAETAMEPTPEELAAAEAMPEVEAVPEAEPAPEPAKVDRSQMTVPERRAALESSLEAQRQEMDKARIAAGRGEVQERLSRPVSPTPEELIFTAREQTGPTPGELEFREQAERDYIERVKEARIPEGLKGKPNAIKMMNKGYRKALQDFGGLSSSMAKSTKPNPQTDSMGEIIAKMGGIGRATAESEGFDPAMFKGSKIFSAKGKMSFDDAAEALNQEGFRTPGGQELSAVDVVDMLYGEVNNAESHFSTQVSPEMMTADAQLVRGWEKALGGTGKLNTAVQKALAGEKLGKRQAEIVEDMLDTVSGMRAENAEQARAELDTRREERNKRRIESFNKQMQEAIGRESHIADVDAYNQMLNEMPDHYSDEQVILDEMVATAGDQDFFATSEAIDQYETGKTSLPQLLTRLSDITQKRPSTYEEAKPAIQKVSEPAEKPTKGVFAKWIEPSEAEPAAEPAARAVEPEAKAEPEAEAEAEKAAPKAEEAKEQPAEVDYKDKSQSEWEAISKQAIEGTLSPEQYAAGAKQLLEDRDRVIAEIDKAHTKPQILKKLGPMATARYKSEKKAEVVKAYYRQMIARFSLDTMISYGMGKDSYENAVIKSAEGLTPEKIESYKKDLEAQRQEVKARYEGMIKAVKNPETLKEFKDFVSIKGEAALSTEQRAKYDQLLTEAGMAKRGEDKASKAIKKGLEVEGVEVTAMEPGTHGKTGEPIVNIKFTQLGKEEFKKAAAQARSMGGGYWRGNFYVPDQATADQFVSWVKGESIDISEKVSKAEEIKEDARVKKLTAMADKLEAESKTDLDVERRENTARQMRMADSSRAKAESNIQFAKMLRSIAEGVKDGSVKYLAGLSNKTQLEALNSKFNGLKYQVPNNLMDSLLDRDANSNLSWKAGVSAEEKAQYARYPLLNSHISGVERWASEMYDAKGYKQAGAALKKLIRGMSGNVYINLDPKAPYFEKLLDYLKSQPNYITGVEAAKDYGRLQRMGIDTPAALRTALIELDTVKRSIDAPTEKTTIQKMERDLKRKIRLNRNAFNDFFPTPQTISDDVVSLADVQPGMKVLEPSAGNGELADAMNNKGAQVDVVELAGDLRAILEEKGYNLVGDDFTQFKSDPVYDRIVMNPPFSNDQDIDHVYHAYNMLKPGGRLVAIVSSMAGDRSNRKNREFKEWFNMLDGQEELLPSDAFMDSLNPTAVRTKTLVIDKPTEAEAPKPEDATKLVSFSQESIVTGTPKGMSAKEADLVAKAFINEYKGAANVKVTVFQTQKQVMDYLGIEDDPNVLRNAVYAPWNSEVVLVADNLNGPKDASEKLRHEILAHHGLMRVVGQDEWQNIVNLVSMSRESKGLAPIWAEIDKVYSKLDENAKAEEVIAKIAETEPGKLGEWGNRIVSAIIRALRKVGLVNDRITETEIKNLIRIVGERIKTVGNGYASIKNDIRFSQELTAPDGFSIPDETRKDAILRSIADKYRRLKITQKAIKEQGGVIGEEQDVYLAEELFHGKVGEDLRVMEEQYIKPLTDFMGEKDISSGELDLYLIAKHAPERNAQIAKINPDMPDGGSGMTDAEAAAILSRFNAEGRAADMATAANFVYGMLNSTKQRLLDSGLETGDVIDAWDATYQNYVPLKGFAENETDLDGNKVKATGKGFSIHGKETMRAMGRRSVADSPIAYAVSDSVQSAIRARKNEVAQKMLNLVTANPDAELWEVFSNDNPDTARQIVKRKNPETGKVEDQVIVTAMPMFAMKDKYLGAKVGGEQYYIKLKDPRLMEAMANLGTDQAGQLTMAVGKVTRLLSAMITSYNPEFALSNFARDVQTAIYNVLAESKIEGGKALGTKDLAKEMVKDLPNSFKALKAGLRDNKFDGEWGSYFKEYLEAGAKTGWFVQKDIDDIKSDIQREITTTGPGAKNAIIRSKDKLIKFVDDYNDVVENASRLSVYVNARRQGLSEKQAASLAKNLTVNFNRKGELSNTINALYMFFNASIQGTANMLRAVMTPADKSKKIWDPEFYNMTQKIAMALPIATFAMAQANRQWGGDDDDGKAFYDKIPGYLKETNFIFMIPGSGGDFIKIPMPYGYNFFAAMGSVADEVINGDKSAVQGAFDSVAAFAGAFSPLGSVDSDEMSKQVIKTATPSLLKPFVEMATNETFTGAPIYKQQNPFGLKVPDAYNSQRRTWEWAKGLSEFLNDVTGGNEFKAGVVDIAPETWQHLAKFAGGGLGSLFGRSQDLVVKTAKGEDVEARDVPFFRKYIGSISESVDIAEMYKRFDEIKVVEKQATMLPGEERLKYIRENRPLVKLVPTAKAIGKEISKLNSVRKQIEASKLSDEVKQARIKKIDEQKRKLAARFNRRYNEAVSK